MTGLPVDVRKAPYKKKYLTEETLVLNYWMVLGTYEDGTVAISDGQDDVMTHVPLEKAQRIVVARNAFCAVIDEELGL